MQGKYPVHGSFEKAQVIIDVLLLMTSNIEQFAFLRSLEKDAFQENL